MNKSDLEKIVDIRIKEAQVLLDAACYEGAYYLAGYALECAIKACIAKQVQQYDFPNKELTNQSYTHNFTDLLGAANLKQRLNQKEQQDNDFKLNWSIAKDWNETARYKNAIEANTAKDLYEAITNSQSGILIWLKKFW